MWGGGAQAMHRAWQMRRQCPGGAEPAGQVQLDGITRLSTAVLGCVNKHNEWELEKQAATAAARRQRQAGGSMQAAPAGGACPAAWWHTGSPSRPPVLFTTHCCACRGQGGALRANCLALASRHMCNSAEPAWRPQAHRVLSNDPCPHMLIPLEPPHSAEDASESRRSR